MGMAVFRANIDGANLADLCLSPDTTTVRCNPARLFSEDVTVSAFLLELTVTKSTGEVVRERFLQKPLQYTGKNLTLKPQAETGVGIVGYAGGITLAVDCGQNISMLNMYDDKIGAQFPSLLNDLDVTRLIHSAGFRLKSTP